MDHDHFIVVSLRHRKSLAVLIDLMRLKLQKGSVFVDIGNRSQQGLLSGHIIQSDHEEFVMAVGIGELHTAIH